MAGELERGVDRHLKGRACDWNVTWKAWIRCGNGLKDSFAFLFFALSGIEHQVCLKVKDTQK